MCEGCWEGYGSPAIDNALVREGVEAERDVYQHNGVGGNLHIVLDDWNIEDDNLDFCEPNILNRGENPEQREAELRCLDLYRRMTLDERASSLALAHGFWGGDVPSQEGEGACSEKATECG